MDEQEKRSTGLQIIHLTIGAQSLFLPLFLSPLFPSPSPSLSPSPSPSPAQFRKILQFKLFFLLHFCLTIFFQTKIATNLWGPNSIAFLFANFSQKGATCN